MTDTTEWLTVAEAARRLGLSDRHARRLVDRLEDSDRLKQGTSPLRVRLAALAQLWEREEPEADGRTPGAGESPPEADTVARARLEERLDAAETLITELRQDKRQLQDALTREQENHLRLLDQLAEERQELRLLQARIIQALPPAPERETDALLLRHPAPEPEAPPEEESEPVPSPTPPAPSVEPPAPTPPRPLTFWERLARWVGD